MDLYPRISERPYAKKTRQPTARIHNAPVETKCLIPLARSCRVRQSVHAQPVCSRIFLFRSFTLADMSSGKASALLEEAMHRFQAFVSGFRALALSLAVASLTWGGPEKMGRGLESVAPGATVDVIVQYHHAANASHRQRLLRAATTHKAQLDLVGGEAVSIPGSSLALLANDPEVAHIAPDHAVRGMLDLTTAAVNANIAWKYGFTGKGIGVADIDSGVAKHPDLSSRVVYSESFAGDGVDDSYGHGTHVAGI